MSLASSSFIQCPCVGAVRSVGRSGGEMGENDRVLAMVQKVREMAMGKSSEMPSKDDMQHLIDRAMIAFLNEESLLEIEPPVIICGDVHGQLVDLMRLFDVGGWPDSKDHTRYLFLGDYVDRGPQSIETICLMFSFKVLHPKSFYLLRGNHESGMINRVYGFYDDIMRNYNDVDLWNAFNYAFNCMPLAGLVSKRIFCMHGGLSPDLESFDQIRRIKRPIAVPDSGLISDLLWADPDRTVTGFQRSARGVSRVFGPDVVEQYCAKLEIDLVARAHQVMPNGYEFFAGNRLVTLFSAPDYGGRFRNSAILMLVDPNLYCTFKQVKSSLPLPWMAQ